jgi:hypothetical protein
MGDLSDFERGQIVMSVYTNHGKTSAKRNSGRKSSLTERDDSRTEYSS